MYDFVYCRAQTKRKKLCMNRAKDGLYCTRHQAIRDKEIEEIMSERKG